MEQQHEHRRSFLGFALFGLGGIFSAILGFPVLAYIIDPRHRTGPAGNFKLVEGIKLDELVVGQPRQGVLRDTRTDGWVLYPNDVIGRVWVVKLGERPADLDSAERVAAFNAKPENEKKAYVQVFTTICPHLGCSVNLNDAGSFTCPCHMASFQVNGTRVDLPGHANPAARDMDTLEWKIDDTDPTFNRIEVKFLSFLPSQGSKEAMA